MRAITFVDSKFLDMARAQSANFAEFGIEHSIIDIPEQTYGINLWMHLLDETVAAIREHGKIFRVDAEIRMLKRMPDKWHQADNVLFFIEPFITYPWYAAINTGHMILSESGIPFLEKLKFMTECMIPPGYDGVSKLGFDDEDMSWAAIRLSGIEYLREVIDYDRSDDSTAACTRGEWYTPNTVFTHGFMHNWNTTNHPIGSNMFLRNNFCPELPTSIADATLLGLKKKISYKGYWDKLGFDDSFQLGGWYVDPPAGAFWCDGYQTVKTVDP